MLLALTVQLPLFTDGIRDMLNNINRAVAQATPDRAWPLGRFAYVDQADRNSETAIQMQSDKLDYIIPNWYYLTSSNCSIDSRIYPRVKEVAQSNDLDLLPLYTNQDSNGVYINQTDKILQSADLRICLGMELAKIVKADAAAGAVISFTITADMKDNFLKFVKETAVIFEQENLKLYVAVDAESEIITDIARSCDGVIVNMYRRYGLTDIETAPAPSAWFEQNLERLRSTVPQNKLIISLGQYGILVSGNGETHELSFSGAIYQAHNRHLAMIKDTVSGNLVAKSMHEAIWLLGPEQAKEHLNLILSSGIGGIAVYRLGTEHPVVWDLLKNTEKYPIQILNPPPYVYYESTGEVLTIKSRPSDAGSLPTGYILSRSGDELPDNSIMLTFDDGPDPKWTPLIIDLLIKEQVPAVFFVVGEQMERWPEVANLLKNPLFTVGNHSYSHPHLDKVSH